MALPLWLGAWLTHRNMPLPYTDYYAKFGPSSSNGTGNPAYVGVSKKILECMPYPLWITQKRPQGHWNWQSM